MQLSLTNLEPGIATIDFPAPVNWNILPGEQWAIIGDNGSGKSLLADLICGCYLIRKGSIEKPEGKIRKLSFESAYALADYSNMYYQQRFNASENDLSPTVGEVLEKIPLPETTRTLFYERLKLQSLLPKHLILLSSGELRRVLIAEALMQGPALILFDNPFIGLDSAMREELDRFFSNLASFQPMIFLLPAGERIPEAITHVLPARGLAYGIGLPKKEYLASLATKTFQKELPGDFQFPAPVFRPKEYRSVLKMEHVHIAYGDRVLFDDLNWEIKKGEKWALLGPNGSGKSTLLSLLAGDNPRAYSQNISVFDRRRGTGESIWEIKKPIGYISSEMHLYFRENQTALRIVASGLFDTIGLFRQPTDEQNRTALQWMEIIGVRHLAERSFLKLSGGEQRLVLLARTFVKNPEVLILDEPFHGLDQDNKKRLRAIIEAFCKQENKSVIYVTHHQEEIPECVDKIFEL